MCSQSSCQGCAYKRSVPGSTHTRCVFDWAESELSPPEGDEHGIENGWYMFPLNFDPVWMTEDCKAFSTEEDPDMVRESYPAVVELLALFGSR